MREIHLAAGVACLAVLIGACSPAPARDGPARLPAPPNVATTTTSSAGARPPPAPETPQATYASQKLAGADHCATAQFELGPAFYLRGMGTQVVAGFGPGGGLAAWQAPDKKLALRPLDREGKPRGPLTSATVPEKFNPKHVAAFEGGFLVIGDLYEFSHMRSAALATDTSGVALGPAVELDLEHRYIQEIALAGGRDLVVLATRALMVPPDKEALRGRWLAIHVGPDGKIEQHGAELDMAYPLVRVFDVVFLVDVGKKTPTWYIRRGSDGRSELISDGKLERITTDQADKLGLTQPKLVPDDEIDWILSPDPVKPTFQRTAKGTTLGAAIDLPAGVGALELPLWNRDRWVIGFSTSTDIATVARLVTISCR